jgi:hypothetical protein
LINKGEVILKLLITIVTAGRSGGRKRFERKSVARGYGRVRVFTSPAKSFPGVSLLGCYFSPVSRSVFDISFRLYIYIYIYSETKQLDDRFPGRCVTDFAVIGYIHAKRTLVQFLLHINRCTWTRDRHGICMRSGLGMVLPVF